MSPLVAIVILNWNGRKVLEQFLPSVLRTTYPNYQVILADNASTDDSCTWVANHYPQVRIIAMDKNRGYAEGYNRALQAVTADYYVLLNSDVEVQPGWLEPMIRLMETGMRVAACQPRILSYTQRDHFEYAGAAGGWLDAWGYPFCRGRVFDTVEKDIGQYNDHCPVFWASGAALLIRSRCFHEMGGFDPYFFAHQEEIDLCWRLQHAGYEIYVEPASIVYHLGGGTLPQGNSRKTYLNFRNNLIMLWKNLPAGERFWKVPLRFCLDGLAAWKELLGGKPQLFGAVVKAHLHVIGWWLFHRKNSPYPMRKSKQLHGLYSGLLPWQYFGKQRRTFKELKAGSKKQGVESGE